jgi:hypothetical protein
LKWFVRITMRGAREKMGQNLLPWDREQVYLMPPSMREWLREEDLAWFIVDAVEQMELRDFYAAYRNDGWGAAAYDPAMTVAVFFTPIATGFAVPRA